MLLLLLMLLLLPTVNVTAAGACRTQRCLQIGQKGVCIHD
jgi:hypothetical protein